MTRDESLLSRSLSEDPEIRAALSDRGLAHANLEPLAQGYMQFLKHAGVGGAHPGVAVRAFWAAHRASSGYPAFAQAYPHLALEPTEDAFTAHRPSAYAKLYATVAMEEDFIDASIWPDPSPPRALGLTDRQARWLYALVLAVSAWLVLEVYRGVLGWPILLVVPLFAAFAVARFAVGRAVEDTITLSPRHYREALTEAGLAWPVQPGPPEPDQATWRTGVTRRS
jgi:hypothetical protein